MSVSPSRCHYSSRFVVVDLGRRAGVSSSHDVITCELSHSKCCGRVGGVGALVLRSEEDVTGDVRIEVD